MTLPLIRSVRQIKTYLWSPEKAGIKRHILVDTSRYEGYNLDNNYDEQTETMVFESWIANGDNISEMTETTDGSKGMYQMHSDVVNKLLSRGYVKLKTKVIIRRSQFRHDFSVELMKRIFGVNYYGQLSDVQRKKFDALESTLIREGKVPLILTYGPKLLVRTNNL